MANPTWDNTTEVEPRWDDTTEVKSSAPNSGSAAQAAVEGFGQGATLGYLPQIQAMAEPITDRIFNAFTGENVEPTSFEQSVPGSDRYIKARDENIARQKQQTIDNPVASYGGQIAGTVATSLIPGKLMAGSAKGAGTLANVARGSLVNAGEASLMNPGDKEGEFNPLQVKERVANAKFGAIVGLGAGLATKAAASAVSKSKDVAEKLAFKASGAMLKDFRKAADKDSINDLGRLMLDKVLKAGDTFDDVSRKSDTIKASAGKQIGDVYKGVLDKLSENKFWQNLDPAKKSALSITGFKPVGQKKQILSGIDELLGDSPNKDGARDFIEKYVDNLGKKYGDDLDIVTANKIKGDIDKAINYGRRIQDLPEKQEALLALRNHIKDRIEDHISVLDDIIGGSQVKELRAANKLYGAASEIEAIAHDRVQRESAKDTFSLSDKIVGAAGITGGATAGAVAEGDVEGAVKGAALGAGAGLISKAARKYGVHASAKALDAISKSNRAIAAPAALASMFNKVATGPDYKKGEPKTKNIPPPNLMPADQKIEGPPQKGRDKWANDGYSKVVEHSKELNQNKSKLFSDPKLKELLVIASDLKPGSKAMDNIVQKIKARMSEGEK